MNKNKRLKNPYYQSLIRKMALIVIIVSFTPLVMASCLILDYFHSSYHEKVYAHLGELVQKHQQNIDGFLTERLSNIRFLANSYDFEELSDESFLQNKLTVLQQDYGTVFEDLGVVNEKGLQVAYAGPFKLEKAEYSKADWFKKAMNSRYFISDVFMGLRGQPHFIVSVKSKWQGEWWILRATINFLEFNSLVENLRIGKTGFAFILNREKEFQTKLLIGSISDKKHYMDHFFEAAKVGNKGIHIVEKKDEFGNMKIYVGAFLKNNEWLLVCQQNTTDAFFDLNRFRKIGAVIFLLGGLGIISTAYLMSRRMVNRIATADKEKEMMNQQVIETGKLATIGELAAGIAHEINNPVAIMVEEAGWIEDLLEEEEFKEGENLNEFKRALKQIHTQGGRCKEITFKLLSFARKTDSRAEDVQVNDLIEEVVALSAQRARYGKVLINENLEKDLPFINISQSEMQQVFLNLINNACDAMEKKGGTIEIKTQLAGDYVEVEIADNGPGIAKANLARIFDPFFTTKPVGKGTGLGLSICYGIINKIGGKIDVRSVLDVGTTFRILLPLKKEKAQHAL
ncbi:MAG: two-component sensor histidine kinase [Deltaproteobacteria bacterium]|nr:two-component sensor histidine kinase [Deltaproteobacteria bacterium]